MSSRLRQTENVINYIDASYNLKKNAFYKTYFKLRKIEYKKYLIFKIKDYNAIANTQNIM